MDLQLLKKRLEDQDWDCCYCGYPIRPLDRISVAFDNNGIAHVDCCALKMVAPLNTRRGPAIEDMEWFCPFCGRHAKVNTSDTKPPTFCCDACEVVYSVEAHT